MHGNKIVELLRYFVAISLVCTLLNKLSSAKEPKHKRFPNDLICVKLEPIKGMNPWEEDWLKKNKKRRLTQFPRGDAGYLEPLEKKIIKEFYESKGLKIYDLLVWTYMQVHGKEMPECNEKECKAGYTIFFFVLKKQLNYARELGLSEHQIQDGLRP
ncbi:MAG: hypothetical protein HQL27_05730 [Candidatus Omnitrophica bacterium]|nr:hypothetical protein [Candidatus Omnitrophota bacterium]